MATQADSPRILVDHFVVADRECAIWTLNRPQQMNPLDAETIRTLRSLLSAAAEDDALRAIVITGSGPGFSAGGDLKAYQQLFQDGLALARFMEDFEAVCGMLERVPALTIAMINGVCAAGGLELALSCDMITVSCAARVGDAHLRFGQLPGTGGGQRLVRAIGYARAKRWLLSGRLFGAEELVEAGLTERAVPPAELRAHTESVIGEVVVHSALAVAQMKRLIRDSADVGLTAGLHRDRQEVSRYIRNSHDATEGINAFTERRRPQFTGS